VKYVCACNRYHRVYLYNASDDIILHSEIITSFVIFTFYG